MTLLGLEDGSVRVFLGSGRPCEEEATEGGWQETIDRLNCELAHPIELRHALVPKVSPSATRISGSPWMSLKGMDDILSPCDKPLVLSYLCSPTKKPRGQNLQDNTLWASRIHHFSLLLHGRRSPSHSTKINTSVLNGWGFFSIIFLAIIIVENYAWLVT